MTYLVSLLLLIESDFVERSFTASQTEALMWILRVFMAMNSELKANLYLLFIFVFYLFLAN